MAGFIAKQMVGNQLKSVKGAMGGDDDKKEEGEGEGGEPGEDPEIAEARREAEERRIEKHRKMEEERETMRQEIRDKYGIKKKEPPAEGGPGGEDWSGIGRKRKTPAELAAEAEAAENEEDDLMGQLGVPQNVRDGLAKVTEMPSKLATEVGSKCEVQ